jgi:hypothetical protein
MKSWKIAASLLLAIAGGAAAPGRQERVPDCSGPNHWPANMALAKLKNAGLITNAEIDFAHVRGTRLSSEEIRPGLFRQVNRIVFPRRSGSALTVLTIGNASLEECSMDAPAVFVISRVL